MTAKCEGACHATWERDGTTHRCSGVGDHMGLRHRCSCGALDREAASADAPQG